LPEVVTQPVQLNFIVCGVECGYEAATSSADYVIQDFYAGGVTSISGVTAGSRGTIIQLVVKVVTQVTVSALLIHRTITCVWGSRNGSATWRSL
jgi:hypothetical protein